MRNIITAFLLLVVGLSCFAQNDPSEVTLLRLLANPDQFEGKDVQVIGFLHLEFEGNGLYLHKEDYDHSILGNMIWIDATADMQKAIAEINDRYVIIRGTFDSKDSGHMGLFTGTLKKITRCDVWSSPEKPRTGKQSTIKEK